MGKNEIEGADLFGGDVIDFSLGEGARRNFPEGADLKGGARFAHGVGDPELRRGTEAETQVIGRVPVDDDGAAPLLGELQSPADEFAADALSLQVGPHGDRAHGVNFGFGSVRPTERGAGVPDPARKFAVPLRRETQVGEDRGGGPHPVDHQMFAASGRKLVPEGVADQLFHFPVLPGEFRTQKHFFHFILSQISAP